MHAVQADAPPTDSRRGAPPLVRAGVAAGLAAPAVFVGTVLGAGAATPGYGQLTDFVSELGQTGAPAAWFNPALVLAGVLLAAFAAVVRRVLPVPAAVPRLLLVVAGSFVVMAVSTCSAGCPIALINAGATMSDAVHNAAAIAGLTGIGSAALLVGAEGPAVTLPRWYTRASAIAGVLVAILSMTFLLAVISGVPLAIGISERVLLLAGLAWVEVTAIVAWRRAAAGYLR